MTSLGSAANRARRLERSVERGASLGERRLTRLLRELDDSDLQRLRERLAVADDEGAEKLLRRYERRLEAEPDLGPALARELARRGLGDECSPLDAMTLVELRELIDLLRLGRPMPDGQTWLSDRASARVERLTRRGEVRLLLGLNSRSGCWFSREGCNCGGVALDRVDADPRLRRHGVAGVRLVARRLHVRSREGRSSGAGRRRRLRERTP